MFGTSHCCNSSSSCLSDTREPTPALVGAERRTFIFERAVRALRSASDVARTMPRHSRILLTSASVTPHLRGGATLRFQAYATGFREGNVQEN